MERELLNRLETLQACDRLDDRCLLLFAEHPASQLGELLLDQLIGNAVFMMSGRVKGCRLKALSVPLL